MHFQRCRVHLAFIFLRFRFKKKILRTSANDEFVFKPIASLYTVNQLLFAKILFRDLVPINWFVMTNVRAQAFSRPAFCYYIITIRQELVHGERNIRDDDVLTNPAKISRTGMKVCLQYLASLCKIWLSFTFARNILINNLISSVFIDSLNLYSSKST